MQELPFSGPDERYWPVFSLDFLGKASIAW
jgi:hypothetical protein